MSLHKFLKLFFVAVLLGCAWLYAVIMVGQAGSDEVVVIQIDKGEGVITIIDKLQEHELLDSVFVFKAWLAYTKYDRALKPGAYELAPSMSMDVIARELISGVSYNETTLTFLEGWNLRQVADYLQGQGFITAPEELYRYTGYPAQVFHGTNDVLHAEYEFLASVPQGYSLEGFIFPDTYRVFENASVESILRKVLDNFDVKYQSIEEEVAANSMSLYDIMKIASVVVKEARTYEDKRKVAGVFLNRMKIGMALQSDPTVNYVTLKVTDNPSLEDIATESEYNTYKYAGLPPTPIANPGLEDIKAVLNPVQHEYYFFLNTKQGEMIFSRDFDEHRANRVKYGQ